MRVAILDLPAARMADHAGPVDAFSEARKILSDAQAYSMTVVSLASESATALNGARFIPTTVKKGGIDHSVP